MSTELFFANILLSNDFPMGRMKGPSRKKGDWYHSISVFTPKNFTQNNNPREFVPCTIIHFWAQNGSPVLATIKTKISFIRRHKGQKLYKIHCYPGSFGVIGHIRTEKGYITGFGNTNKKIKDIIKIAFSKWGYGKIPYAHQRNESYNCVGFVDDILIWTKNDHWNKRIEKLHKKYGLYIDMN